MVHMLASSQLVPSGWLLVVHAPVAGLHPFDIWHTGTGPGQSTGIPGEQTPTWQTSPLVQALLSEQLVPSATGGFEQAPDAGSQVPAPWQESVAAQVLAVPGVQVPFVQTSPVVQALLSEQVTPFGEAGFEHVPLAGLQTPAIWHWSLGAHTVGVPPVQTPIRQASPEVQALPSLQVVPSGAEGFEQAPVV